MAPARLAALLALEVPSAGPRLGRPRLRAEWCELIATRARDNPLWGSARIRGELLKLGIAVSKRSIKRYRGRGPQRPPSQTWRTFLQNHAARSRRRTS